MIKSLYLPNFFCFFQKSQKMTCNRKINVDWRYFCIIKNYQKMHLKYIFLFARQHLMWGSGSGRSAFLILMYPLVARISHASLFFFNHLKICCNSRTERTFCIMAFWFTSIEGDRSRDLIRSMKKKKHDIMSKQ